MMNVDNKDVSSLISPCKMRDFSSYNLLFCIINNLKKYQLSFLIQRRKLLRLSMPVLTQKLPLQNPCDPVVKYRVCELLLLWAVGTGGENQVMITVRNVPIYKALQYCKTNLSTFLSCPFRTGFLEQASQLSQRVFV